jgi:putative transcriptional regulator
MKNLTGKLLLATPELLTDHIFSQAVILMAEHNEKGSMGFIINKPSPFLLSDFFPDMPIGFQLWKGGPVDEEMLFYMHDKPQLLSGSVCFDKKTPLCLGGDFQLLRDLVLDKDIDANHLRFFMGYSGWGPGQLEKEIEEKAWYVVDNDINIFSVNPKDLWKKKLIELNPQNIVWKNSPINPELN